MKTSYFVLGSPSRPTGLFRLTVVDGRQRTEFLSRSGEWVLDYSLVRYVLGGESGAEGISLQQARDVVADTWKIDPDRVL